MLKGWRFLVILISGIFMYLPGISNDVLVSGYIKYADGVAAAGRTVYITTDSLATGCSSYFIVTTDSQGYYEDTISCSANISIVHVFTTSCAGDTISGSGTVNPNLHAFVNLTLSCNSTSSNTVIIKGKVTYSNGAPAAGRYVQYATSGAQAPCFVSGVLVTDPMGYFSDTISCSTTIPAVSLQVRDCLGNPSSQVVPVAAGIAEGNFALNCNPPASAGTYQMVVKGQVNYSNGQPFPNKEVWVLVDTTNLTGCNAERLIYTDSIGQISDTFLCSSYIANARVKIIGCSGNPIYLYLANTESGLVEFTVAVACNPAPCQANLSYTADNQDKKKVSFSSAASTIGPNHVIVSRQWTWGDGTSTGNNNATPIHTFPGDGVYTVNLAITTSGGCQSNKSVNVVVKTYCKADFKMAAANNYAPASIAFNSTGHSVAGGGDSLVLRRWNFGDGSAEVTGMNVDHTYQTPGTYTTTLYVTSSSGCMDSISKQVSILPPPPDCKPYFNAVHEGLKIIYYDKSVLVEPGDSIINRSWDFGDNSTLNGSEVANHVYAKEGVYKGCLTITTAKGCVKTFCKLVVVSSKVEDCAAHFIYSKSGNKTVIFNGEGSWENVTPDTVVSIHRWRWNFGDGQVLDSANAITPTHVYSSNGVYNVCLTIEAQNGCINTYCAPVNVQDTVVLNQNNPPVQIVSSYPVPATNTLTTIIHSQQNNLFAELSIYDMYGTKKWSGTQTFMQGNNVVMIPVNYLPPGTYILKASTAAGSTTKIFTKI